VCPEGVGALLAGPRFLLGDDRTVLRRSADHHQYLAETVPAFYHIHHVNADVVKWHVAGHRGLGGAVPVE
jgi:hypothetical protein